MSSLFLFLITLCAAFPAQAFDVHKDYLDKRDGRKFLAPSASVVAFDHTVRFTVELGFEGEEQCAGLLLRGGYLLSARHCIEKLLAPIAGYDEALAREEFLQRVKAYEQKNPLKFPITIFSAPRNFRVEARLASIGAGFKTANTRYGMRQRLVRGEETLSGSDADWVLLDIGVELNADCVPISQNNFREPNQILLAVGAPVENDRYGFISGDEIRVSIGTSMDSDTGIKLLTQDDILDGQNPGSTYSTIFDKTGFGSIAVLPGYSGGSFLDSSGAFLGVTSYMLSHFRAADTRQS